MFRFYLHSDNQYYRVNSLGQVVTTTTPTPISTPKGWEETRIGWGRNLIYWGLFRAYTQSYEFVEDGANILRRLFYAGFGSLSPLGYEAKCTLSIEWQRGFAEPWRPFFSGDLDFSQFRDSAFFVSLNIMESGAVNYINSYADTNFEIPVSLIDRVPVYMDGLKLNASYKWKIPRLDSLAWENNLRFIMPLPYVEDPMATQALFNHIFPGTQMLSTTGSPQLGGTPWMRSDLPLVGNMRVKLSLNWWLHNGLDAYPGKLYLGIGITRSGSSTWSGGKVMLLYDNISPNTGQMPQVNIDEIFSFQINPGDDYYIYLNYQYQDVSASPRTVAYEILSAEITYDVIGARLPAQQVSGYRTSQVFQKLCSQLTESTGMGVSGMLASSSDYFNTIPKNHVLIPGDSLRNIPNPKIVTSFSQFYRAMNAQLCVGVGAEGNNIRMEHLSYFLNPDVIIADLGEVSNLTVKPASDYLFNSFKIGYPDANIDDVMGRQEYNTQYEYKAPVKRIKEAREFVCDYPAGTYQIELYRANLSNKTTTDNHNDNETFLVEISDTKNDQGYLLRRQGGNITGLIYPDTAYNIGLTPRRMFYRLGQLLRSIYYGLESFTIKYQTSQKNNNLTSWLSPFGAPPMVEKGDVAISELPSPMLFKPFEIEFTGVPPENMMDLMGGNPVGCFRFTWQGNTYKGFPLDVSFTPATMGSYDFKVLCTPDTDITKLIN